jgi:hypothetical protein
MDEPTRRYLAYRERPDAVNLERMQQLADAIHGAVEQGRPRAALTAEQERDNRRLAAELNLMQLAWHDARRGDAVRHAQAAGVPEKRIAELAHLDRQTVKALLQPY